MEYPNLHVGSIKTFCTTARIQGQSGVFFRVEQGIPTYLVRFRKLGDYQTPNYEAIELVEEARAQVKIELGGNVLFGRFMPIATSEPLE
ncbi:MAG TPA: hypothetical protein VJQ26_08110 [Ktedonobacteraceae bacterium]|nr:hypothetical protein [Ktedonobacteraceae bacterium]